MKIKISKEDITAEVDVNGRWRKETGPKITIDRFNFVFAPRSFTHFCAYSLDSLKLFDEMNVPFTTGLVDCATRDGYIKTIQPLINRIGKALRSGADWSNILYGEYCHSIVECGARNAREHKLIEESVDGRA